VSYLEHKIGKANLQVIALLSSSGCCESDAQSRCPIGPPELFSELGERGVELLGPGWPAAGWWTGAIGHCTGQSPHWSNPSGQSRVRLTRRNLAGHHLITCQGESKSRTHSGATREGGAIAVQALDVQAGTDRALLTRKDGWPGGAHCSTYPLPMMARRALTQYPFLATPAISTGQTDEQYEHSSAR